MQLKSVMNITPVFLAVLISGAAALGIKVAECKAASRHACQKLGWSLRGWLNNHRARAAR